MNEPPNGEVGAVLSVRMKNCDFNDVASISFVTATRIVSVVLTFVAFCFGEVVSGTTVNSTEGKTLGEGDGYGDVEGEEHPAIVVVSPSFADLVIGPSQ